MHDGSSVLIGGEETERALVVPRHTVLDVGAAYGLLEVAGPVVVEAGGRLRLWILARALLRNNHFIIF